MKLLLVRYVDNSGATRPGTLTIQVNVVPPHVIDVPSDGEFHRVGFLKNGTWPAQLTAYSRDGHICANCTGNFTVNNDEITFDKTGCSIGNLITAMVTPNALLVTLTEQGSEC